MDFMMAYAVVKGVGAGVTLGVHQDRDLEAGRDTLLQLNPEYAQMRILRLCYTSLRAQDVIAFVRLQLRLLPQTGWGDYNRTYTLESALQVVFDRLSVPRQLAHRVPPVDRSVLLSWTTETTSGASWNFSKPLLSYPPLKCFPPGEGAGDTGGADVPLIDSLTCTTLTANTAALAELTVGLTTAQGGNSASNVQSVAFPLSGDQSQGWCRVTCPSSFQATLTVGGDVDPSHYLPCLVTSIGNGSGVGTAPTGGFANGVVIMGPCAPAGSHSISVRAVNPPGVVEVVTCGNMPSDPPKSYCVKGAVVYSGTAAGVGGAGNGVQVSFSQPVSVRYGVQHLNYT